MKKKYDSDKSNKLKYADIFQPQISKLIKKHLKMTGQYLAEMF